MTKRTNRYRVVHEIAEDAKQSEIRERDPLKQLEVVPTVNQIKEKRNFVKESFDKIVNKDNKKNKKKP